MRKVKTNMFSAERHVTHMWATILWSSFKTCTLTCATQITLAAAPTDTFAFVLALSFAFPELLNHGEESTSSLTLALYLTCEDQHMCLMIYLGKLLLHQTASQTLFVSMSILLASLTSNSATCCSHACIVLRVFCSVLGLVDVSPLALTGCVTLECATDLSAPFLGSK